MLPEIRKGNKMVGNAVHAIDALNQAYIRLHPYDSLNAINQLSTNDVTLLLQNQSATDLITIWNRLTSDLALSVLLQLPESYAKRIVQRCDPVRLARLLLQAKAGDRDRLLGYASSGRKYELNTLVQYPKDSAGSLMDPRIMHLYETQTVSEALQKIKKSKSKFSRQIYLVDKDGHLQSMVEIHKLAVSESQTILAEICQPVPAVVVSTATKEEVVALLGQQRISDLPVVDIDGLLIGIIRYTGLMEAVRDESSVDILTMVGANRDERALSKVGFVVRKRLPWLSINLLTAFLAASVVGLFESTIAKYTALAVLLPVVAGQSGNTGAQALAVTMRGLALREIGTSQWYRVARKEISAAFINGVAIALMTSLGVFVWSNSIGLALVIGISMVIAMLAAAFSGVVIPVTLSSLGQDPAQSSSIILTTVTDVVGFFAFLGIATILSGLL